MCLLSVKQIKKNQNIFNYLYSTVLGFASSKLCKP